MRKKLLSTLMILALVFNLAPVVAFAEKDDNISITLTNGGELATPEEDYSYSDNTYTIRAGDKDLCISGYTENDNLIIADGYTGTLTIKDLTMDLSGVDKRIGIEAKGATQTIVVKGTNNITLKDFNDQDYSTKAVGIYGKTLDISGDGSLYVRTQLYSGPSYGIYVEDNISINVGFLYLCGCYGIMNASDAYEDIPEVSEHCINITGGTIVVIASDYGIYGAIYDVDTKITGGEVYIYSGGSSLQSLNIVIGSGTQLIAQSEGGAGCIYADGKFSIEENAKLYATHLTDSNDNVNLVIYGGVFVPAGEYLKGSEKSLAQLSECTDIEDPEIYSDWGYQRPWRTLCYGDPTFITGQPLDFKTEKINSSTYKISGLEAPSNILSGMPKGRWYYTFDVYNNENGSLSCLNECVCNAVRGRCKFHRMTRLVEGKAGNMLNLCPLEVSASGEATITGITDDTEYFAIVYGNEDIAMCDGSSDNLCLSYAVGLADIYGQETETINNNANVLVPDPVTRKVREILPHSWRGEWELDTIMHTVFGMEVFSQTYYYIGSTYEGKLRTKGGLVLTLNPDCSYTLSGPGIESQTKTMAFVPNQDNFSDKVIDIFEDQFILSESECGEDGISFYRETVDEDSLEVFTYNFVRSDVERVNLTYGNDTYSIVKGTFIESGSFGQPEKEGFVFGGLYLDADKLIPFSSLELTTDSVIYEKWFNQADTSYITKVEGVVQVAGAPTAAWISILNGGSMPVGSGYSNEQGEFSINLEYAISPGLYQVEIYKDETFDVTLLQEISSENVGTIDISPNSQAYVVLQTFSETPFYPIAIGNMDAYIAENPVEAGHYVEYWIQTFSHINEEPTDSIITSIAAIAGEEKYLDCFDFFFGKAVDGASEVDQMYTTGAVNLQIVVTYPTKRRQDFKVIRYHDDTVNPAVVEEFAKLDEQPASGFTDGTYYVDENNNQIIIYSNKFSTFGIASNPKEGKETVTISAVAVNTTYSAVTQAGFKNIAVDDHFELASGLTKVYYLSGGAITTQANSGATSEGGEPIFAGDYKVVIAVPDTNEEYEGSTTVAFKIAKKPVTVTANNKTSYVGDALPLESSLTYTYNGFVNSETFTTLPELKYAETPDMTKTSSYAIVLSNAGIVSDNYELTFVPGTFTVTAKPTPSYSDGGYVAPKVTYKTCKHGADCIASKFTDVDLNAWYHDGLHYCVDHKIVDGTSATTFEPQATLSRAEMVTLLWKLEGRPVVNYALQFTDIDNDAYYIDALRWASSKNIVTGYGNGKFGPSDSITREQLATVLYKYVQTKGEGFKGSWMFLLQFDDRTEISGWADEAVHWCYMKKIVEGKGNNLFDPNGNATRAEAAVMMQRFCEREK